MSGWIRRAAIQNRKEPAGPRWVVGGGGRPDQYDDTRQRKQLSKRNDKETTITVNKHDTAKHAKTIEQTRERSDLGRSD